MRRAPATRRSAGARLSLVALVVLAAAALAPARAQDEGGAAAQGDPAGLLPVPVAEPQTTALEVENAELQRTLAVVKSGLAELEASTGALRADLASMAAALGQESAARQAAEAAAEALRQRLAEAAAGRVAADAAAAQAALEQQLAESERLNARLSQERDALAGQHRQCQSACAAPAATIADLNRELETLKGEREALRNENADFTTTAERCVARLSGYDAKFATALAEIERLEAQCE